MNVKVTLRMDDGMIKRAKAVAKQRGTSVSQIVSDYFAFLEAVPSTEEPLPPLTNALFGVMRDADTTVSTDDYKKHLEDKFR